MKFYSDQTMKHEGRMKNFSGSTDFKVCNSCISECYLGTYFRKNPKGVNQEEEENRIQSNSKGNSRKTAIQVSYKTSSPVGRVRTGDPEWKILRYGKN